MELMERAAVAYEAGSKAPDGTAWDASAARERIAKWASSDGSGDKEKITWSKYRRAFAWYDPKKAEEFGGYELPHHDVIDGELKVVWHGVVAAAAVLRGARGGAKGLGAAKPHIARHYRQFGETAPWESKKTSTGKNNEPPMRRAEAGEWPDFLVREPQPLEARLFRRDGTPITDEELQEDPARADEAEYYEFPVTSETPYPRWMSYRDPADGSTRYFYGDEILGHDDGECDMTRAADGGAIRDQHWGPQVGVTEDAWIGEDKRGWVRGRFSRTQPGRDMKLDVDDKIRRNVSGGYTEGTVTVTKRDNEGRPIEGRRTGWQLVHTAIVPDAADATVGFGRGHGGELISFTGEDLAREGSTMHHRMEAAGTGGGGAGASATAEATRLDEAVRARVKERDEILDLCRQWKIEDAQARKWVDEEKLNRDQVGLRILEARKSNPLVTPPAEQSPFTARDMKGYSYRRAIAQAMELREGRRVAGREAEYSQELGRHLPDRFQRQGGLLLPLSVRKDEDEEAAIQYDHVTEMREVNRRLIGRAMGTGIAGAGAEFVFAAPPRDLLDVLRNRSVVTAMGGTVLDGLTGPVPFPKLTSDPTLYWTGENPGSAVSSSQPGTEVLWLNGKMLSGKVPYPRQLVLMSSINIEMQIRRVLGLAGALALDRGGLTGKGGEFQPLGIFFNPQVTTVDWSSNSGKPDFTKVVSLQTQLATVNADIGTLGTATTPAMAGTMRITPRISGAAAGFVWEGGTYEGEVAGHPAMASNQLPTTLGSGSNEHGTVFGNWSDQITGIFGPAMEILLDPYTLGDTAQYRLLAYLLADTLTQRTESFAISAGAHP